MALGGGLALMMFLLRMRAQAGEDEVAAAHCSRCWGVQQLCRVLVVEPSSFAFDGSCFCGLSVSKVVPAQAECTCTWLACYV